MVEKTVKIVFIGPDGRVYTEGTIGYAHDYDTNLEEIEPGSGLQDLDPILDFVRDHFAPDKWWIKGGKVRRWASVRKEHRDGDKEAATCFGEEDE